MKAGFQDRLICALGSCQAFGHLAPPASPLQKYTAEVLGQNETLLMGWLVQNLCMWFNTENGLYFKRYFLFSLRFVTLD